MFANERLHCVPAKAFSPYIHTAHILNLSVLHAPTHASKEILLQVGPEPRPTASLAMAMSEPHAVMQFIMPL